MLNQVIIVGRLTDEVKVNELENGKKEAIITLAVPKSFKNADGIYETDFINCVLWEGIAKNTAEYCKKGDVISVKGRIQVDDDKMIIIAEKVTFLSSKKMENETKDLED